MLEVKLLILILVIGTGMNFLWRLTGTESWLTVFGIFGHAFISTALAVALFVFYRDRINFRDNPESWWGYSSTRLSAEGMPTKCKSSIHRFLTAFPLSPWCWWRFSAIWEPMDITGLSDVIGSWKIIEMRRPRNFLTSFPVSFKRFCPSNKILPDLIFAGGSSNSRTIDNPVTVLPQPLSPTRPRVWPSLSWKDTLSTALITPSFTWK